MKKVHVVQLSADEQSQLRRLTMQGKASVRQVKRAQILLAAHNDKSDEAIAGQVGVSVSTVCRIRQRYANGGLAVALAEQPRSGRPLGISGATRAKVTALACSAAPAGRSRWTLRLLADKVVELTAIESLSYQSVRNILKKTNCSRT
jgi:putative transposase